MSTSNPLLVGAISAITTAILLSYLSDRLGFGRDVDSRFSQQQLGYWASLQLKGQHQAPLGPQINATLPSKLCGTNSVSLSRIPQGEPETSSWSIVLAVIRKFDGAMILNSSLEKQPTASWLDIPLVPLTTHESHLCVKISRATLMTLFALTNARRVNSYSSASGYRSSYPSYCGQWSIAWPIGKPCVVRLSPHDSHTAKDDVYPAAFRARVDKCVEMMAGIISDGDWKIAFPGRAKYDANWVLEEQVKGFGGAHGSRHLYNMQGGRVFDVDLLAMVPGISSGDLVKIQIPSSQGFTHVSVAPHELSLLAKCLDSLPWSSLSWSLHRGLKDILLAYGKRTMNLCRENLAAIVQAEVATSAIALIEKGWEAEFVRGPMAGMAGSAILAGIGNSGDLVRIVVGAVECLLERNGFDDKINLDRTDFWKSGVEDLDSATILMQGQFNSAVAEAVVALTKFFVLEWSQELDYQLYHDLPVDILLA